MARSRSAALVVAGWLGVVPGGLPPAPALAQTARAPAGSCDEGCLSKAMGDFLAAMAAGRWGSVPLTADAEIRENTQLVTLERTAWTRVKAIRSVLTFADPVTGNVVSRAGVELAEGQPGYISTRLRIAPSGRVSDVEISADVSPGVVSAYVWNLDPQLDAVLPQEQRATRVELEALGRRYFHALSSHQPVAADFDDVACNRFHSGRQITNAGGNTVEGGPPRSCVASMEGDRPWGPATEQRFPVIDVARGIVCGVTLLHYPKSPDRSVMYVSEVFKVVAGRIVKIDNIGLMMRGVETTGFVH